MTAYYNEIDPYAAQWLRNLILQGHLPRGDVDERSIVEVQPDDLHKYTQCHFFAGIGGWPLALRMSGWDDTRPVWTGSCPCQPFSSAGKQNGKSDERHLWPVWFRLIRELRPVTVFGEQVASAIAFGWLDECANDLESEGFAVAAAVLPACSVGAPHRRDRLWFVADNDSRRFSRTCAGAEERDTPLGREVLADSAQQRLDRSRDARPAGRHESANGSPCVSDTNSKSPERAPISRSECRHWAIEPDVGRVANGIPARVGRLRAYGNAIVPQVAAEFITAYMECRP